MGALIVFFFVLIGAVIIFYASAKSKLKNYENDQKDYQLLVDNLNKLETRLQDEADHWPIYARPMWIMNHNWNLQKPKRR
jgi:CHASE3 domain sensor protein